MEFVHQPYQPGETIAAVLERLPPGEGGSSHYPHFGGIKLLDVASPGFVQVPFKTRTKRILSITGSSDQCSQDSPLTMHVLPSRS